MMCGDGDLESSYDEDILFGFMHEQNNGLELTGRGIGMRDLCCCCFLFYVC